MRYLCLIHSDEALVADMPAEDLERIVAAHGDFQAEAERAGVYVGGDRLRPTTTATTVRVTNGEVVITDGPFAESKEALGGYYMIDVEDLDQALHWAARIPSCTIGCVEVRPVWEAAEYMSE